MLVLIVSPVFFLVRIFGWIKLKLKLATVANNKGFIIPFFLQILKWIKFVWDLGIINKHSFLCEYLDDQIDCFKCRTRTNSDEGIPRTVIATLRKLEC